MSLSAPSSNLLTTSPLTTLDSCSTPTSYHTAKGSPSEMTENGADDTNISSAVDSEEPCAPQYRSTRKLPRELREHIQIKLEEGLHAPAIRLLDTVSSSGSAPAAGAASLRPAFVAPPKQLALLANLAIHPLFTTRPAEPEDLRVAAQAIAHLRRLVDTVGPVNANLCSAFKFRPGKLRRRGRRNSRGSSSDTSDDSDGDDSVSDNSSLGGQLSRDHNIWKLAPDFWAVVGWAFRCASEHPHRWRYWRLWLDFIVHVLEQDWEERLRQDEKALELHGDKAKGLSEGEKYPSLKRSLLMAYLDPLEEERKKVLKEVLRAIFAFADGSPADASYYKEVFNKETVVPAPRSNLKRKRTKTVNIADGQWGDYFDNFEDDVAMADADGEPASPSERVLPKQRGRKKKETAPVFRVTTAMEETVPMRLRLFGLLSSASFYLQKDSHINFYDLYEDFTASARGLPLPMFKLFIISHTNPLKKEAYVTLMRNIVEEILPDEPPRPSDVDKETDDGNGLSQAILEKCYLPKAAKQIFPEENAKLSMLLEQLLRFLWTTTGMSYSPALRKALGKGIAAREAKINSRKKITPGAAGKGDGAADQAGREALERSARNLMLVMDFIEDDPASYAGGSGDSMDYR